MKKKLFIIVFIISCVTFIVSVCALALLLRGGGDFDRIKDSLNTTPTNTSVPSESMPDESESETKPLIDNPIDFAAWQALNADIYAWIKIPGTPIDYPILQRADDELYYLRRDYLGNYYYPGCIFTQFMNKKDFTDPNTVIYGHQTFDGTFFGPLHDFEDENFFAENDTIYIYIPGHILTYRIFSAYLYDSRHILKAFDFSDKRLFAQYLQTCLDPDSTLRNVREGVSVTEDDRIITLSTCMPSGSDDGRYLVQGVLINDEPTK